ncbi:MAG: TolC family protein [Nitrospirota bacterium]
MNSYFKPIAILHVFIICILFISQNASAVEEYSLEDLYRIALERSERIMISEEDLYISERGKDKALSALLPTLSAFWDYTKYSEGKTSSFGDSLIVLQPEYSALWGLRLDQSMSLGGRELTAFRISRENIEKSKYDLYAVREDYLFNVASAYYDVLRAQKALEIARVNVERLRKHRDAASIRLKVGEVTKTDLLRAEAELSGAQSELVRTENGLKLAKAVLARIVGLSGDYDLKEPDIKSQPTEEYVLLSLKEKALFERAELKSVNLQKKISEDQVKYAQGAYWPILSLGGVYSRREEDPASPFFLKESIYGVLNVTFPFFEGGLRRAEVGEAKARLRQAQLIYEDLKKTINIEVENAYLDFQTQKGVLKSLEDEVTFARDNFNSISRQYEFGLADSIDVIDANTLLLISERQLADARYNYQLSILRLERVTGVLLKTVIGQESRVESRKPE